MKRFRWLWLAACAAVLALGLAWPFFSRPAGRAPALSRPAVAQSATAPSATPDATEERFADLARTDPAAALKAADALAPAQRIPALLGALRVVVAESPDLAFATIDAYGDDAPTRTALLQGLLARWTRQAGPDAVHRYFLQRPTSASLDPVYAALAATVAEAHPDEANAWLVKIGQPALRESTTLAVAAQIEAAHPEISARLIFDLMATMPERAPEAVTLARMERPLAEWARRDRTAAFSYLYSLGGLTSSGRNALLQKLALSPAL